MAFFCAWYMSLISVLKAGNGRIQVFKATLSNNSKFKTSMG